VSRKTRMSRRVRIVEVKSLPNAKKDDSGYVVHPEDRNLWYREREPPAEPESSEHNGVNGNGEHTNGEPA
jgi:hypothetical protein